MVCGAVNLLVTAWRSEINPFRPHTHTHTHTYTSPQIKRSPCVLIKKKYFRTFKVYELFEMIWIAETQFRFQKCASAIHCAARIEQKRLVSMLFWLAVAKNVSAIANIRHTLSLIKPVCNSIYADIAINRRVKHSIDFQVTLLVPRSRARTGNLPVLRVREQIAVRQLKAAECSTRTQQMCAKHRALFDVIHFFYLEITNTSNLSLLCWYFLLLVCFMFFVSVVVHRSSFQPSSLIFKCIASQHTALRRTTNDQSE